jgi:ring-1,2-phenylacetyl-CoA epoxidase subunit PaaC
LYSILNSLGEPDPDANAFNRPASSFRCAQFVELPNSGYDFSLMRHFLYDHADQLRFEMLAGSSFEPVAKVARKIKGEIKYHVYHANTWVNKLGSATQESHARMQSALNEAWNYALGIFEEGPFEDVLRKEKIFEGEKVLMEKWLATVTPLLGVATLTIPASDTWSPVGGGRKGFHTDHLAPLVEEMSEVFRVDPSAEW